jgi:uncharacterized membrane protein
MLDTLLTKPSSRKSIASSTQASSHLLSLVKGISWRVVGTIDTMMIAFLVTGKIDMALSIGSVEIFTKIFLYYVHDRAWEYLTHKKKRHSEA